MKKKVAVLLCAILCLVCVGCKSNIEQYTKEISEIRENIYCGADEEFSVEAITGVREVPFIIDGKTTTKGNYTIFTITPKVDTMSKYTYIVKLNNVEHSGEFVRHPFDGTYSAEIASLTGDKKISLNIICEDKTSEVALSPVKTDKMISSSRAFEIALAKLGDSVKEMKSGGDGLEIYIRLTKNPINNDDAYYWYVAFVNCKQKTLAVLIDPLTEAIKAERIE